MKSLRIIVAMIEPPLPFGNAAARWFYVLLKELKERGHRVTSFAVCSKEKEIEEAKRLFPAPDYDLRLYPYPKLGGLESKYRVLTRPFSYMFGKDFESDLNAELDKGFDVLHLEQLWSGWVGLRRIDRSLLNIHHLVEIDLSEAKPKNFGEWLEQRVMFRAERMLNRRYRFFRTCSPRLEPPIKKLSPRADLTTIPVGIDPSLYEYIPDEKRVHDKTMTLIGSMGWYPGYSAAVRLLTRLFPEIRRRVPEAKVRIVGWGARSALKDYLNLPGVEIVENVPDTRPYFEATDVFVYAPSRGSGMKIKVLESMGYGIPIVTTSEGVEGLPAIDGVHAGIAEDDAGLIDRAVALLNDPAEQNRRRRAAREMLETHCGPKPTVDALESIYSRMIGEKA